MPEITVSMAAGRTDEQKAGMMRDITQALVKNLGVDADAVVIQINEAPLAHKMKGGKTFVEIPTPHGDNHDMWIDPPNTDRMILGNAGGTMVTFNAGGSWSTLYNQPTGEFYHVASR